MSYTNESCDREAFKTLDQWLSIKYPDVHKPMDNDMDMVPIHELYDHVIQSFLEAARLHPEVIDADVQVGLGILFYNSGQYDKAVDCFSTALQVRPKVSYAVGWGEMGWVGLGWGSQVEFIPIHRKRITCCGTGWAPHWPIQGGPRRPSTPTTVPSTSSPLLCGAATISA